MTITNWALQGTYEIETIKKQVYKTEAVTRRL